MPWTDDMHIAFIKILAQVNALIADLLDHPREL
jgi:hypothetical protein